MVRAIYYLPSKLALSATPEVAFGVIHSGPWQMCQGSPWAENTHLVSQEEDRPDHRGLWTLIEYFCTVRGLFFVILVLSTPGEETCPCPPVLPSSFSWQPLFPLSVSLWSWERCLHTFHNFGISPPWGKTGIFAYEEALTWG